MNTNSIEYLRKMIIKILAIYDRLLQYSDIDLNFIHDNEFHNVVRAQAPPLKFIKGWAATHADYQAWSGVKR